MRMKNYTLPRHTNLANQGLRITAAIVDFAINLALILGLIYGVFNFAFASLTQKYVDEMNRYQVESHLRVYTEDGKTRYVDENSDAYRAALEGYYLRYLAGKPLEGEAVAPNSNKVIKVDDKEYLPSEYYNVQFFNEKVLGITQDDPEGAVSESYFTYPKDAEGHYLKDQLGIPRTETYNPTSEKVEPISEDGLRIKYSIIYTDAVLNLTSQKFYRDVSQTCYFIYQAELALALVIAGAIVYILLPFILHNGQTVGKKIFKLGLASYEGYKFHDYQLLLRFVPYLILSASLLLPIWTSIGLTIAIFLVVVLISFAFMMASPKKTALHDFAARTLVIDLVGSTIFENEIEEEIYIRKEDGLPSIEEEEHQYD